MIKVLTCKIENTILTINEFIFNFYCNTYPLHRRYQINKLSYYKITSSLFKHSHNYDHTFASQNNNYAWNFFSLQIVS